METAGAATPDHLVVIQPPSTTTVDGVAIVQQPIVDLYTSANAVDTAGTNSSDVIRATITSGGVSATSNTATASSGVATFSGLTLNALAGPYTLTFTDTTDGTVTSTVWGTITVSAGSASQLAIATQPSTGDVSGVALVRQPVVKVEDSGGNVITSVTTGSASVAVHTGTATLSGGTTASFVAGVATFSGLTLNGATGTSDTLEFTGDAFTSPVSNAIAMSTVATKLAITTAPATSTSSGAALAPQPIVTVEDATGNPVVADASTVTATVSQGGTLTNATAVVVNGVAAFSGLTISALAGPYTLTFSDGTLTSAVSATITVTVGAATKLVVTTEPTAFTATGVALATQPVVKVEDSSGNVVTSVTSGNATVTINTGVGGSVSAGATAVFSAGVATFSGLTITGAPGSTYTLKFTGDSLSVNDATPIAILTAQATLSVSSVQGYYGRSLTLTSSGGSGSGAVTFAVTSGGTATGCTISGSTLTFTSTGTCLVTATKAADSTYLSVSSTATTVTIISLPRPGAVRVNFKSNSWALSATARAQLIRLSHKLTNHSSVTIIGYAKGNRTLAKRRATAVRNYLFARVHFKVHYSWNTSSPLQAVRLVTTGQ
ncbi:MAG TPA: hypothetical protein VND83_07905 [Acidimicrobiales bacterium]|nr:hypothetical protein [Acidimicrobiales bacterium]